MDAALKIYIIIKFKSRDMALSKEFVLPRKVAEEFFYKLNKATFATKRVQGGIPRKEAKS